MKTAYCPDGHEQLASETAGKAYGHVPGHQYHDVDVVISTPDDGQTIRVHVCESWGSAQGRDEEYGRREAIARGDSVAAACSEARDRAKDAGITCEYLETAMSCAEDAAIEALASMAAE